MTSTSEVAQTATRPADCTAADLLIRPGTQQVFRDGREIPLPKLSFDLLMALVRAAPNTVTQDELMRQVWPGLVISPETVTQRVKLLRDALGDDSQTPRYVGLVRGRGYRFLAPVAPAIAKRADAAAGLGVPVAGRWRWLPAFSLLALLAIATAWWFTQRHEQPLAASAGQSSGPIRSEASIAVLPLAALSPEAQTNDFFAEGIHDELLTRLAQIDGLRVISRSSVLAYRDSHRNLRDIARELGVSMVLEGSVQQVDGRVRINVQLIDAERDAHLWAQTYDRELSVANLLEIQADIAQTVAEALQLQLLPPRVASRAASTTPDLGAYRVYLQGEASRRQWDDQNDPAALLVAEDQYRRALGIDPGFALAYAGLSRVLAEICWQLDRSCEAAEIEQAQQFARRALELVPTLAEAHLALALHHYYSFRDYEQGLAELDLAEAEMPGNADIYYVRALILRRLGRLDEYVTATQRLRELAPLEYPGAAMVGGGLLRQGRLDAGRQVFEAWLDYRPGDSRAQGVLALADFLESGDPTSIRERLLEHPELHNSLGWVFLYRSGDPAAAQEFLSRLPDDQALDNDMPPRRLLRAWIEFRAIDAVAGRAALEALRDELNGTLDNPQVWQSRHNVYRNLALTLAALGEKDAAIEAAGQTEKSLPLTRDHLNGASLLVELAMVYAEVGEAAIGIALLERALQEPFAPWPTIWQFDPRLDPLRNQPGFQALLERYGGGAARWRAGNDNGAG